MNIYLTLDYELFFGTAGTADKCILEPTEALIEIGEETGAKMTFFVDVGYLIRLQDQQNQFSELKKDYDRITNQIKGLIYKGHNCQLHIHPHWEDSFYTNEGWKMDVSRYKLADFSKKEAENIVKRYHSFLSELTGQKVFAYRAGGWCLQPFNQVKDIFRELGITIDSTVFPGGKNQDGVYDYDFSSAPFKDHWSFSDDLNKPETNGFFTEYPIASDWYSPAFFFRLFGLGRLQPSKHKPIGDGYPVPSGGSKWNYFKRKHLLPVSMDGYFVTRLPKALHQAENKGWQHLLVIGHPKACTHFALDKLLRFIRDNRDQHNFCTFSQP